MASPTIGATVTTNNSGSSQGSPSFNLPAGISDGDTLIAVVTRGNNSNATWPSGWTKILDLANGTAMQTTAAWRKAVSGDSSGTVVVTFVSAGRTTGVVHRISGATDPTVTPPEIGGSSTTGTGTAANALTCTPTGGSKDYLWITLMGLDSNKAITTEPTGTGYGNLQKQEGTHAGSGGTGTGNKAATAASDDAGDWTNGSDQWVAATIAIHPGAAGPTPATDLYGLKCVIKTDGTDLYGLKGVVKTDGTDDYGLKAHVHIDATDLYGLKGVVKTDATDLYGLKGQVKTDATDLYGLKGVVSAVTSATDLYGLKGVVKTDGMDLYGLKGVVKTDGTDLYGLKGQIKTDATDLYGLKIFIFFTATDLYGLKGQVKDDATDLYGLQAQVKTDATDLYGLKGDVTVGNVWGEKAISATSGTEKTIP